jgi:hypothetical protein
MRKMLKPTEELKQLVITPRVDFSFISEYDIRKLNPERKARPNV